MKSPKVPAEDPRVERINKQNRRREAEQQASQPRATSTQPAISKILNLMEQAKLSNPANRAAVLELQRHYDNNENLFLFSTMMLFAKRNLLSDDIFNFLKSSMNIITHVCSLMGLLADVGLMSKPNVDSYINLPVLKGLNVMFNLLGGDRGSLTQSRFEQVVEQASPITETLIDEIKHDDKSSSVVEALIRCAANHIDTEEVLQQVKAHPYPQRLASAVIEMKEKGIEMTKSTLESLVASDNPSDLIENVIRGIQTELGKPAEDSWLSSAAELAGKGLISALGFFANSTNSSTASRVSKPAAPARGASDDVGKSEPAPNSVSI